MAIPELTDASDRLTDCIYFGDPISSSVGSGFVATNRTLSTTLPLTGGGDLSANRTFAINNFAGSVAGAVPPSTGGVVTFLRADGSWATPPTFGAATVGYAPASGGGAVNFLRADGTWAAPAGSTIAGLTPGVLPVATAADAIGDSRVTQSASGYSALVEVGQPGILNVTYDGATVYGPVISSADSGGGYYVSGLRLTGGGVTTAAIDILADGITLTGDTKYPAQTVTLANGPNVNVGGAVYPGPNYRVIGPTAFFTIGSLTNGADGAIRTLYNTTSQVMILLNEDPLSTATGRIITGTGTDVTLAAGPSVATLQYSGADQRWVLVSTNPPAQYSRTIGYVPYENADHDLASSSLYVDLANNRYGFYTPSPKATVDINGTLATRAYNQALSNGLNSDLPEPTTSYMRVTGPTGAFSVGGVIIVTGENGKRLTIHNTTAQAMTLVHEDASSTAANRINTLTAANVVFPARQSVVHLVYSATTSRWILDEANPVTAGGATTQVQHNLSGELSGDSGLVVAGTGTAKTLTIGTDVTFSRKGTRHLELGTPNASPSNYILAGNSAIGGTDSNKIGGAIRVGGGAGTGEGHGGDTILRTAYQGTFGNTQNSAADRLVYNAHLVALTDSSAAPCFNVGVPTETGSGGTFWYTVYATDGTDMQIRRGRVEWGAVNKAGAITIVLGTPEEVDCTPVGTLTVTVAATDITDDTFDLEITPVSSLTTTTFEAWGALAHDGKGAITPY